MNRKEKIDLLNRIQTGEGSVDELSPIKIIVEHPDGTFTCNGQPVRINVTQGTSATNSKFDYSGVSFETLLKWKKQLSGDVIMIKEEEAKL